MLDEQGERMRSVSCRKSRNYATLTLRNTRFEKKGVSGALSFTSAFCSALLKCQSGYAYCGLALFVLLKLSLTVETERLVWSSLQSVVHPL